MSAALVIDIPAAVRRQIVDTLCPPLVVDLVQRYAHGDCVFFAVALAQRLGVDEVVACFDETVDNHYWHWAVPVRGTLLDAYGKTSLSEISKRYMRDLKGLRMPVAEVLRRMGPRWDTEKADANTAVEILGRFHKWRI